MIKLRQLSIVCALLALCFSAPLYANKYLADFWKQTKTKIEAQRIPGFSLVYVEKDKDPIYYSSGVTAKSGEKVDHYTLFRLASVSKTFTGGLVTKLVEQGKLEWQQPLAKLAPKHQFSQNNAQITLHHLLSQSSGLMPNAYDNLIEADYALNRIINELSDLAPICQPGDCYTYQNALFGVLEQSFLDQNLSYADVLQQELLTPLNMDSTSVGKSPLENSDNWAKPHVLTRKKNWVRTKLKESYYRIAPAAGVNTNSHDMGIWIKAMLGEFPNVVSEELVKEMTSPNIRTSRELRRRAWRKMLKNAHYGLGWRVYDLGESKIAYHSGWVSGYRAEVSFSEEHGVGIAMLMNAESNLMNQLGADFWSGYLAATK